MCQHRAATMLNGCGAFCMDQTKPVYCMPQPRVGSWMMLVLVSAPHAKNLTNFVGPKEPPRPDHMALKQPPLDVVEADFSRGSNFPGPLRCASCLCGFVFDGSGGFDASRPRRPRPRHQVICCSRVAHQASQSNTEDGEHIASLLRDLAKMVRISTREAHVEDVWVSGDTPCNSSIMDLQNIGDSSQRHAFGVRPRQHNMRDWFDLSWLTKWQPRGISERPRCLCSFDTRLKLPWIRRVNEIDQRRAMSDSLSLKSRTYTK